ncbi:PREDICTED: pentatricopeptide repeat-containing protein At1g66345, mitochondrial [Tarenaya hassleriana]|uniref:pentatricopeptide repeat-containing protein At1g66345, mitochondrial n=1 Tax=Tarenaya hassleriana TaxID=28532 RepID=UPI00053C5A75|nr:PREDICTED: pentatricopeptide repeat-containing protein At1g66345, mitochondrial [Tarenaya hassleriana]
MASLRRNVSLLVSKRYRKRSPFFSFLHTETTPNNEEQFLVDAISESLRNGDDWEALSEKFSAVDFSDTLVEKVLLRFRQPENAKRALSFFHWSAKSWNRRHGISSYAVAIHILVRACLFIDARALIESVLVRSSQGCSSGSPVLDPLLATYEVSCSSPLVFDLLVQGYAKLRFLDLGFDVCLKLGDHGFSLSVITFNTLIHFSLKSDRNDLVWRMYERAIEKRTYPNETTTQIMINALCKEGKLKETVDTLDRIQGKRCSPPVIVNTSLILRVLEEGRIEQCMSLLKRLLQKNMILDTIGYSLVVCAKVKLGDMVSARRVFDEMLHRGFNPNSFVYTAFIRGYCEKGEIDEANRMFSEMEDVSLSPYGETFDLLIKGCSRFGREDESLSYCEKMIGKGFLPSCSAFNELVERLSKIENVKQANEILTTLIDKGFVPNEATYTHMIRGFAKGDDFQEALKLLYEMEYRNLSPGPKVLKSLILCLCSCGKVEAGERCLRTMKGRSMQPDADIYEALIKGYHKIGDKRNASRIYDEMVSNP